MLHVTITDRNDFGAPMADFVRSEILRLGAAADEIEAAVAFVGNAAARDIRAYQKLSPRMRRLVDLVGVAGCDASLASAVFPRQPNEI